MVEPGVIENIKSVFDWHRTWIAFKNFGEIEEFVEGDNGRIFRILCRVMHLEVRIHNNGFDKGQLVSIPEFELESALERHKLSPDFKRRLAAGELTAEDVNLLIYSATWCQINPELE